MVWSPEAAATNDDDNSSNDYTNNNDNASNNNNKENGNNDSSNDNDRIINNPEFTAAVVRTADPVIYPLPLRAAASAWPLKLIPNSVKKNTPL